MLVADADDAGRRSGEGRGGGKALELGAWMGVIPGTGPPGSLRRRKRRFSSLDDGVPASDRKVSAPMAADEKAPA